EPDAVHGIVAEPGAQPVEELVVATGGDGDTGNGALAARRTGHDRAADEDQRPYRGRWRHGLEPQPQQGAEPAGMPVRRAGPGVDHEALLLPPDVEGPAQALDSAVADLEPVLERLEQAFGNAHARFQVDGFLVEIV